MSDYTWHGDGLGTIEQVERTFKLNQYGVASGTISFRCDWDFALNLALSFHQHPDLPFLFRKEAEVIREEANQGFVRISFEGVPFDLQSGQPSGSTRVYGIEGATESAPIETHPNFKNIAGTPAEPNADNDARWDGKEFLGFGPDYTWLEGSPRIKVGLKAWDKAGIIYTETEVKAYVGGGTIAANLNALNCIDTPPNSPLLPNLQGSYEWMLISCTADEVGNGVRIVRKWKLSGPRGFDPDLYQASALHF